jgi:cytochrome P450
MTLRLSIDGAVIAGTFLPGGTIVGMSAFVTHTDFEAFGPTARQFQPERWISSERGELEKKLLTCRLSLRRAASAFRR